MGRRTRPCPFAQILRTGLQVLFPTLYDFSGVRNTFRFALIFRLLYIILPAFSTNHSRSFSFHHFYNAPCPRCIRSEPGGNPHLKGPRTRLTRTVATRAAYLDDPGECVTPQEGSGRARPPATSPVPRGHRQLTKASASVQNAQNSVYKFHKRVHNRSDSEPFEELTRPPSHSEMTVPTPRGAPRLPRDL